MDMLSRPCFTEEAPSENSVPSLSVVVEAREEWSGRSYKYRRFLLLPPDDLDACDEARLELGLRGMTLSRNSDCSASSESISSAIF